MIGALAVRMNDPHSAETTSAAPAQRMNALLLEAAKGDRASFNALFLFFAPRVKSYLMKIGAAADLAEDLAQEAMLKVWKKASLYDPARASAATWIFTIARNLRIDAVRRAAKAALDPDDPIHRPEEAPQGDEVIDRSLRDGRIRTAFAALPEAQAEVVRLHFIDDLAHSEIAERLALPLGTVKSRLRLAFAKIRKDLEASAK